MSDEQFALRLKADHGDGSSHVWTVAGHRGRATDYECTWVLENEHGRWACHAKQTRIGSAGSGFDCVYHGRQASSPCYSCERTPWRGGAVDDEGRPWPRCDHVDTNGYGDSLRCVLLSGHAEMAGHEYLCPSYSPDGDAKCYLPYDHPGDHHVNRDGTIAWVDIWIGPPDRKTSETWDIQFEQERKEKEAVR